MLSPSSSISNLSNTNSNKKFKPNDDQVTLVVDNNHINNESESEHNHNHNQENNNKKLPNGIAIKNMELNDVTNSSSDNMNVNKLISNGEQKLNGNAGHVVRKEEVVIGEKCTDNRETEEVMDESEHIQNGNKPALKEEVPVTELDDENDCEMIDESEVKPEVIKAEVIIKSELETFTKPVELLNGDHHHTDDDDTNIKEKPETPLILSEEEQFELELAKLNKLADLNSNNNSELFRSKRTALKHAKALKLKQLEIDLKNEETKLLLLKRLYYSQRIASQPLAQQQQLLRQQQLQQQQKAQQLKKNASLAANQSPSLGNGMQRQSIMNNKPHPNQLNRMPAIACNLQTNSINPQRSLNQGATNPISNKANMPGANSLQRNGSNAQLNSRNNPLGRQGGNSGTSSPVNNPNSKVFPASTTSAIQNSGSSISPSSAFSPKLPNNSDTTNSKPPVVSQAAVSQLVRKELEKSLAQIEFPKPPPQDIYFLPNTNNSEFLMCLGLEEVAKCVHEHLVHKQIKADVKEQQQQQKADNETDSTKIVRPDTVIEITYDYPLFCSACSTDFTPVWRQDKNGLNMCEKCLKQLEKKQIKTEHNARLKQAFLKAVKDKEVFEKQLIAEQQKALELQRAQRAANPNPSPVPTNANNNNTTSSVNSGEREQRTVNNNSQGGSASLQGQRYANRPGRPASNANSNANRGFTATQVNSSNNASRQQQQAMQQRRSLQTGQMAGNKPSGGQMAGNKPGMGNNAVKTSSNGSNPRSNPMANNSGNNQYHQNQSSQNKTQSATNRTGQTSSQQSNQQRQRQSVPTNNNSQKTPQSRSQNQNTNNNSNNTNNASNETESAHLQAQAAQLQLAINSFTNNTAHFANPPALAAFAQQQQQSAQQAAILQRLMQNAGAGGFNPLHSMGLGSPASAALNYLNMFPNQRKNP